MIFFNIFNHFFYDDTPSCVVLGFEVNDDVLCEDITQSIDAIFYTLLVVVIFMILVKLFKFAIMICSLCLHSVISVTLENKKVGGYKCVRLLRQLNAINKKYLGAWNSKSQAEVFNVYSIHKLYCSKCTSCEKKSSLPSYLFGEFLKSQKKRNKFGFKCEFKRSSCKANEMEELKIIFLNEQFKKSKDFCAIRDNYKLKKLNEWVMKQIKGSSRMLFSSDSRDKNYYSRDKITNHGDDLDCYANYELLTSDSESINYRTKISSSGDTEINFAIDEIQMKVSKEKNRDGEIFNNNVRRQKKLFGKCLVDISSPKAYPVWLLENKQIKVLNKKKKCIKRGDSKPFVRGNKNIDNQIKNIGNQIKNKYLSKYNAERIMGKRMNPRRNITKYVIDRDDTSEPNKIEPNTSESEENKQFNVPNNLDSLKTFQQDQTNETNTSDTSGMSGDQFNKSDENENSDYHIYNLQFKNYPYCTSNSLESIQVTLDDDISNENIDDFNGFGKESDENIKVKTLNNAVKNEIIKNIINIPADTMSTLKFRYNLLKNKQFCNNFAKRLDVIFENSPWNE